MALPLWDTVSPGSSQPVHSGLRAHQPPVATARCSFLPRHGNTRARTNRHTIWLRSGLSMAGKLGDQCKWWSNQAWCGAQRKAGRLAVPFTTLLLSSIAKESSTPSSPTAPRDTWHGRPSLRPLSCGKSQARTMVSHGRLHGTCRQLNPPSARAKRRGSSGLPAAVEMVSASNMARLPVGSSSRDTTKAVPAAHRCAPDHKGLPRQTSGATRRHPVLPAPDPWLRCGPAASQRPCPPSGDATHQAA
mmetsp:Transcript_28324/g.84799  ORF Transcript_28324/g.84799 Transcript_28324/m.84799 type:complete len:246 (-) Transcript_28324:651-1388(-)